MIDLAAYGGSWYAAHAADAPERGRLTVETDVDVCVIGGGLAGLTAAREVARRGWSVALIEARRIAWNASGRNMGVVSPGFAADQAAIVDRVGADRAKALWGLSVAGAEYVRRALRECRMPGVEYGAAGWLHVSKTDSGREIAIRAQMLEAEYGAEVEFWPAERVRDALKSALYFAAIHHTRAFTINPLNYALGLAAAAEAAGARIYENTPAISLDPDGVLKRIATSSARLRARHVVIAGNVQIGNLMPKLTRTLVPVWTYVMVTAPLGERLRDAVAFRGGISDEFLSNSHYRVVGGDRLMWSGYPTVWSGTPGRRIEALKADIARAYPQLGDVEAEFCWGGVLGNTLHSMPQIGELSLGVWVASGFGGHGLNTTAMAGELIARAIVEGDDTYRLFAPFELIWAGGTLGRAAVQLYSWSRSRYERFANARALKRETQQPPPAVTEEPTLVAEPEAPPAMDAPRRERSRKRKKSSVAVPTAAAPIEENSATSTSNLPPPDKQTVGG